MLLPAAHAAYEHVVHVRECCPECPTPARIVSGGTLRGRAHRPHGRRRDLERRARGLAALSLPWTPHVTHLETIGVAKRGQHLVHGTLKNRGARLGTHGHHAPLVRAVKHRHRECEVWPVVWVHLDLPIPMPRVRLGEPQRGVDTGKASVMLQTRHAVEQLLSRGRRVWVIQQRLVELPRVKTEPHLGTVGLRSKQNGRVVW